MRLIDADKLFEEMRRNDLEFMQQDSLMRCIKYIIDSQPTITKTTEIKNVGIFDNRKS